MFDPIINAKLFPTVELDENTLYLLVNNGISLAPDEVANALNDAKEKGTPVKLTGAMFGFKYAAVAGLVPGDMQATPIYKADFGTGTLKATFETDGSVLLHLMM